MAYSAQDILVAFEDVEPRVKLEERSGPNGYVRIYGPNGDVSRYSHCGVVVERQNGSVCFTEETHALLRTHARPKDPSDPTGQRGIPIARDPIGYSCGPNYGRFQYGLPADDILQRFPRDPKDFALAVIGALRAANLIW